MTVHAPTSQEGEKRPGERPGETVKVTVNLPEFLAAALRTAADEESKTFTQELKEAISLKLYVRDALEQGAKLLLELPDKSVREIVFY